jgi:hypothetical protein
LSINQEVSLRNWLLIFIFSFLCAVLPQTQVTANTAITPTPAPTPLITPTPSLEERAQSLEKWRQEEIQRNRELPQKDIWDKINSISGLVSGGIIALVGIFFTFMYQERQRQSTDQRKQQELAILQAQTVQSFLPQLQSEDERAVEAALLAIAALGNTELATKLAELFRRKASVSALYKIGRASSQGAEKVLPTLVLLLQDESHDVRRAAAEALGQLANSQAVPALMETLRDESDDVRRAAAEALGKIGYYGKD